MKIYGVPISRLTFKEDADYDEREKALRGMRLEDKIKTLGLYIAEEDGGEKYIGLVPMYPWDNTKDITEITTVGKAKRFIGRQLTRIVEEDLDTIKSFMGFHEN